MIFCLPNFGGLWLALDAVLFQAVFRFAFVGGYVFISNRGGKWWGGCCLFSSPSGSRGLRALGHFFCALQSAMASLRAGACVGGFVGVFLGLSVGAVRVHSII